MTARHDSTGDRPYSTADRPNSMTARHDSTADRPNSMTARHVSTADRPNSTPDRPNSMTSRPNSTPDRPNSMTARPDSTTDTYNSDSYSINSTIDTCNSDTYSTISTTNRIKKEAHAAATHICNFRSTPSHKPKNCKRVWLPPKKSPPKKIFKTLASTRQPDTPTSDRVTFADQHHDTKDNRAAHNSGFKKWRVTSKFEHLCFLFTFVRADSDEHLIRHFSNPQNVIVNCLNSFFEQLCSAHYKINSV